MSAPKHTPGPWGLEHYEPDGADIVGPDNQRVSGLKFWLDDACRDGNAERPANGYLAAAAPEMLEALTASVEAIDLAIAAIKTFAPDRTPDSLRARELAIYERAIAQAKAALAKAEGRGP